MNIPNYKVLKEIGAGGMGTVYLSEHTLIKRKVAIKSLKQDLIKNEHLRERFKKEATALAQLEHPNIVRLNEYIEQQDGIFLIMEYVDGLPLDEHINNVSGPINEEQLIPLFLQILDAFEYAHKNKIVHRDIKPSNIIITKDGKIKILDFGIAKIMDETNSMTKTGTQIGSVLYMSPEQVKGEKVNHLSDIYSLGVTLFQMATGKAPYDTTTNEYQIFQKIDKELLPIASSIYPGISKKLEDVIVKATTKDGSKRFQSCKDFKKDIEKLNRKEIPEKVKEINVQTKTETIEKEKKKKNPIIIILIIGFLLAGVGGYFYFDSLPKEFTNYYDKDWEKCKKENAEFYRIISLDKQGKPVGIVKDFYITGELQREGYLYYYDKNDSKNDIQDSIVKGFYKNGKIKFEGFYNNNLKNGLFDNYDSLGQLLSSRNFKNNILNGTSKWFENENIKHQAEFKNDKLNGYANLDYGYLGDSIKYEGNFSNNLYSGNGKLTYLYYDGNEINYIGEFKDGLYNGAGTLFDKNGEIESGIWKNGELVKKEEFKVPIEVKDEIFYKNKSNNNSETKKEKYPTLKEVLKKDNSKISENKKVKKFKFYDDFEDPEQSAFNKNVIEIKRSFVLGGKARIYGFESWYEHITRTMVFPEVNIPFYIESSFSFTSKTIKMNNFGSGFFVGIDDENYLDFRITPKGQEVYVKEYKNGDVFKLHKSGYCLNIQKGKYVKNILKIKVLKNRTDFFINGSIVHSIKNSISGNRIGFINYGSNSISIDYLKIETL